ncbi:MAG: hypothetical protein QG622_3198 [Actinomycetota bacterium]|nr:hypothetical protein [Actinomycetota bacterium]
MWSRTLREVIINGPRAVIPHQTHLAYTDAG